MKRMMVCPLLLFFTQFPLAGQNPPGPQFEVASIKASPTSGDGRISVGCQGGPGTPDPGMYRCQNLSLGSLITMAYKVNYFQLAAPDWVNGLRFHLQAKVPEGATKDDLCAMVKSLLMERFKLAAHHEDRELDKYDLVVAKNGPKFQTGTEPPPLEPGAPGTMPPANGPKRDKEGYPILENKRFGMAIMYSKARLYDPAATMERLAGMLAGQMRKPVVDTTGLKGKYEINLFWDAGSALAAPDNRPDAGDPGPPLEQALVDQLGLRLVAKKGPVDFVVVDHVEKAPSEN